MDRIFDICGIFKALVEKVPGCIYMLPLESNWEKIPWESGTNLRTCPWNVVQVQLAVQLVRRKRQWTNVLWDSIPKSWVFVFSVLDFTLAWKTNCICPSLPFSSKEIKLPEQGKKWLLLMIPWKGSQGLEAWQVRAPALLCIHDIKRCCTPKGMKV